MLIDVQEAGVGLILQLLRGAIYSASIGIICDVMAPKIGPVLRDFSFSGIYDWQFYVHCGLGLLLAIPAEGQGLFHVVSLETQREDVSGRGRRPHQFALPTLAGAEELAHYLQS